MKEIFTMKKLLICLLICLLIIESAVAYARVDEPAPAYRVTEVRNEEDAQWLWDTVNKYSPSEKLTAGIMGFFFRESGFKSNCVANYYLTPSLKVCEEFTEAIDAGLSDGSTKEQFIEQAHNKGGYGLGQWWAFSYLEAFYDFAQEWGTSISDAEMQCAFIVWSIENQRPIVLDQFNKYDTARAAGNAMACLYDGAPDVAGMFADLAEQYYILYAK